MSKGGYKKYCGYNIQELFATRYIVKGWYEELTEYNFYE